MIYSVGIDVHKGRHRVYCLDKKAQVCDSFSFQTTSEGLATLGERIFRDGSNPIVVFEPAGLSWLMVAAYLRSQRPELPSGESQRAEGGCPTPVPAHLSQKRPH